MITKEILTETIKKAKCKLAKKTIKYYTNLAVGQSSPKAFEQLRMLKFYIKILEAFKIVGETDPCNCCVEGDYKAELILDFLNTTANFQFSKNNEGYMYYMNEGFPFIYIYDEYNKTLELSFTGVEETIFFTNVEFSDSCNIITDPSLSPLETSVVTVTNPSIVVEGFNGSITILTDSDEAAYSLVIPYDIINNPTEVVNYWNTERASSKFTLNYVNNEYVFISPFNRGYTDWVFRFSQFEGGSDGTTVFTDPVTQPFITSPTNSTTSITPTLSDFTGSGLITVRFDGNTIYSSSINYTLERFVENFNLSNTGGFEVSIVGSNLVFNSVLNSGASLNGKTLTINSFVSGSSAYNPVFSGGIDTTALFLYWELIIDGTTYIVYTDLDYVNYSSIEQFIEAFNNGDNLGCTAVLEGDNIRINAPLNSFGLYDGATVRLSFQYESPEYINYNQIEPFENAIEPEIVSYTNTFEKEFNIGSLINDNPCTPTPNEEVCLTNEQIEKIIDKVNSL